MCLKLSPHTLRFNYLQKGQQKTQTKNKWNHWIYNAMLESRQMCDYFRSQRKTWQGFIPVFNLVLSGHTYFNSANKTTVISLRPHENVSHNRTSRSAM